MSNEQYLQGRKEIATMIIRHELTENEASRSFAILWAERKATIAKNRAAQSRRQVYADLGLKRVRGALGGVYYE